jgi:hypothetical protein
MGSLSSFLFNESKFNGTRAKQKRREIARDGIIRRRAMGSKESSPSPRVAIGAA